MQVCRRAVLLVPHSIPYTQPFLFKGLIKYCSYHCYADGTQLYYAFQAEKVQDACNNINYDLRYLNDISEAQYLRINPKKSTDVHNLNIRFKHLLL